MIQDRLLYMRGDDRQQPDIFLYGTLEERIPNDHALRPVRAMTDAALEVLSSRFDEMYAQVGRPSIPPEHLLRALLLQALYSIRSERMLVEQLEYNLLFRWFVGLGMNEAARLEIRPPDRTPQVRLLKNQLLDGQRTRWTVLE
jgi:transposase